MLQNINIYGLQWFNSFSTNHSVELFVRFFIDLPIFILPLFLWAYWIYYSFNSKFKSTGSENKEHLLLLFYSTVLSLIISLLIQQFVHLDRPEQHLQASWKLLLDHLPDASFPSDHATVSIAFLSGLFFAWYRIWWYILFLPFIFMWISRIIAGVHWPFDILAGSLVWIIGSYLIFEHISQIKFVKKMNLQIIKILKTIKL